MPTISNYKYGKVTGLFPDLTVVTETTESPWVCCGYCSAHMACITAKAGLSTKMQNEAHAIRSAGGRPHNNGSMASELRNGASKALGVTLKSVAVADIRTRLKNGYAVVVNLEYSKLPSWLKVQSNSFGHSVCLFGYKDTDMVGFFDPLWAQGARGAWTPWSEIDQALWGDGEHSTTTVKVVPMSGDYVIYDADVDCRRRGKIAGGKSFYNDWQLTSRRGAVGSAGVSSAQVLGYRSNAVAVQISTAQGWSDGVQRPTNVFFNKADVTDITVEPAHVCPPTGGCTDEDIQKAKQEEWDRINAEATATHTVSVVLPPRP